jgi:AcrR family transcriptional regulator
MNRHAQTLQRARALFLDELAQRGIVQDAAAAAGVGRSTVYQWRGEDAAFAAAWDVAIERAADALEREAWRRGVEGVPEPVIGRVDRDLDGVVTGPDGQPLYIRKYSDALLTTMLKARRPEKFREKVDHEHRGSIAVEFVNDWRSTDP